MNTDVQDIALTNIRENPVALRAVNRESEAYLGLVESIRQKGFNTVITVREQTDEDGNVYFELLDGLHRFTAAGDAGLPTIPCMVKEMDKQQAMEWQVMANLHKIETRPIEFTQQLQRMISMQPTLTMNELANRLGKSPSWITSRLKLLKLTKNIQRLVDGGKITLSNAFALAKLAPEDQIQFVDRAITLPPAEFLPAVQERAKEVREARKKGKEAGDANEFRPTSHLQKKSDIDSEHENPAVIASLIADSDIKGGKVGQEAALAGAKIALDWVLNMDAKSIEVQQAKHEQRIATRKAAANKRKIDRAAKKEQEGAAEKAELEAKFGLAPAADATPGDAEASE